MLRIMGKSQLYEEAEEIDLLDNVRFEKKIKFLGVLAVLWLLFSQYVTLYQTSLFFLVEVLGFGYIVSHPTYRLPCKVLRRRTGSKKRLFGKAFYIDVQTEDDCVWTAKVSRSEFAKARKGRTGYIYFTDKDIEKDRPVKFEF